MVMYQFINSYAFPPAHVAVDMDTIVGTLTVDALPPSVNVSGDPFAVFVVAPDGVSRAELMLVTPPLTGTGNVDWPVTRTYGTGNPYIPTVHNVGDYVYFPPAAEMLLALADWNNLANRPSTFAPSSHAPTHELGGGDEVIFENLATAETDTSLVASPNGTGGLEFRAETGGGGGGAPTAAPYVTTAADAGLSAEVVLGTGVIMAGVASSLPAASIAGRLYYETDTGRLKRDNGATWDQISINPSVLATQAILNPSGNVSISSANTWFDVLSLSVPAGTWDITAQALLYGNGHTGEALMKIYNATDSTDIVAASVALTTTSQDVNVTASYAGLVLTATKTLRIAARSNVAGQQVLQKDGLLGTIPATLIKAVPLA